MGTCALLLNAGHEASVNGAGNAWWTLFRHPAALASLRADPSLVPTAVEELCASTRRCRCSSAGSSRISSCTASTSRAARSLRSSSPQRTGTRRASSSPTSSSWTQAQPARLVRGRDPLLPGRAAGQARARDPVPGALARAPGPGAGRDPDLEAHVRAPRPRGAAGPHRSRRLTGPRRAPDGRRRGDPVWARCVWSGSAGWRSWPVPSSARAPTTARSSSARRWSASCSGSRRRRRPGARPRSWPRCATSRRPTRTSRRRGWTGWPGWPTWWPRRAP